MTRTKITILGLLEWDPNLFQNLQIPEDLDKDTAIATICLECGELELAYPNGTFMRSMIPVWSHKQMQSWQKLYDTTVLEYNPIWNKDGTITETVNETRTTSGSGSNNSQSGRLTGSQMDVSAYNSSNYEPREKQTGSDNMTGSGSYSDTGSETFGRMYSRTEQGNIGITSTQQLIKEEREVALFNIYDVIAKDFKRQFCLLIY